MRTPSQPGARQVPGTHRHFLHQWWLRRTRRPPESSWSSCAPFDTAPLCTWTAFFCLGADKKGKQGPWRQQILHPQPWQSIASSYKTTWPETSSTFSTFHLILATWWTWTWSVPRWSQTGQASTPLDSLQIDGLVMFGGLNRKRKAKVEVLCWHFLLCLMSKMIQISTFPAAPSTERVPSLAERVASLRYSINLRFLNNRVPALLLTRLQRLPR